MRSNANYGSGSGYFAVQFEYAMIYFSEKIRFLLQKQIEDAEFFFFFEVLILPPLP